MLEVFAFDNVIKTVPIFSPKQVFWYRKGPNQLTPTVQQLIIFGLLHLEMQIHSHLVSVLKYNFPLRTLAHVDSCAIHGRVAGIHEDILVISIYVHGQKA